MAYTPEAQDLRRCRSICKDGRPCSRYAVWGDPLGRCAAHGGRGPAAHIREKTHYPPCRCVAWPFPHRPGAEPCRWPDLPQQRVLMRTSSERKKRADRAEKRLLRAFTRRPLALFGYQLQRQHDRERA